MMAQKNNNLTVIFDGLCSVCCKFKNFVEKRSDRIEFIPYQEIDFDEKYSEIGLERAKNAVQVITAGGTALSAGRAVAAILRKLTPFWKLIGVILALPIIIFATEWSYNFVANHRNLVGKILRLKSRDNVC